MALIDGYHEELEELRLQVELMGVLVDRNLERSLAALRVGDVGAAAAAVDADDEIDAMNLSLTDRCYQLLGRNAPVAGDLRLVVSVVRMTSELERVGDLALRVAKSAEEHSLLVSSAETHRRLCALADQSIAVYRLGLEAWATRDEDLAARLVTGPRPWGAQFESLVGSLVELRGSNAAAVAVRSVVVGQALDRIADHGRIIGARVRYLMSGEADHLIAEVR